MIIRELANKINTEEIGCIAENSEKYITISYPLDVEIIGKNGNIFNKKITIRFIDTYRFMGSSLSTLVNNLADTNAPSCKGCKCGMELVEINDEYVAIFKCCNCYFSEEKKQLNEDLLKLRFKSVWKFCDGRDDCFRLLLRKGVYPYEYMDSFNKFNETSLPPKEAFYSKLNMSHISDNDYKHAKKIWDRLTPEDDKVVTMGDYHDMYLLLDSLLLGDIFDNFRDTCLEKYKLDPAHFLTAPGLIMASCIKNDWC